MEAKDLRIGNYIDSENNDCDFYIRVTEISDEELFTDVYGTQGSTNVWINQAKPLPITEQWLLKFGFEEKDFEAMDYIPETYYSKISNNGDKINIGTQPYYNFTLNYDGDFCSNEILYVHQLQNLYFALTGEELILKE